MNAIGITLHQGTGRAMREKQVTNKTQLSAKPRLLLIRDMAQIIKRRRAQRLQIQTPRITLSQRKTKCRMHEGVFLRHQFLFICYIYPDHVYQRRGTIYQKPNSIQSIKDGLPEYPLNAPSLSPSSSSSSYPA